MRGQHADRLVPEELWILDVLEDVGHYNGSEFAVGPGKAMGDIQVQLLDLVLWVVLLVNSGVDPTRREVLRQAAIPCPNIKDGAEAVVLKYKPRDKL